MTETINVGTDLQDVFIGRPNIDNDSIRLNNNEISFDLCACNSDDNVEKIVKRSDIEDVEEFFADSLQSRPFARHLLLLLWIREVKFKTTGLEKERVYEFFHKGVFALHDVDLDEETLWDEFDELLDEDYFQDTCLGFTLSPKGLRAAESMFKSGVCLDDAIAKFEKLIADCKQRSLVSIVSDTDESEEPTVKRNPKDRVKKIRKAASEYYTEQLKGNDVKKESIAIKHGLEKNVLSKTNIQEKYGLDKIERAIDDAVTFFGSIPKIEDKEKARLFNLIYNTLKR